VAARRASPFRRSIPKHAAIGFDNPQPSVPGKFYPVLDPSDRVRIHEKVLDYEVDGVPTDTKERSASKRKQPVNVAHIVSTVPA